MVLRLSWTKENCCEDFQNLTQTSAKKHFSWPDDGHFTNTFVAHLVNSFRDFSVICIICNYLHREFFLLVLRPSRRIRTLITLHWNLDLSTSAQLEHLKPEQGTKDASLCVWRRLGSLIHTGQFSSEFVCWSTTKNNKWSENRLEINAPFDKK